MKKLYKAIERDNSPAHSSLTMLARANTGLSGRISPNIHAFDINKSPEFKTRSSNSSVEKKNQYVP